MSGKVITIAQQKGGSGKTTIAANLAIGLKHIGASVALLDTDPQGSLSHWYKRRKQEQASNADNGYPSVEDDSSLSFRAVGPWGARFEAMSLARTHDFVIIDTPASHGIEAKPAMEAADLVVVPLTPSPLDLWATIPTIEMAVGEQKQILTVLNRASERLKITAETKVALGQVGKEHSKTALGSRVLYAEVMNTGHSVIEKLKSSPAAREVCNLTDEIRYKLSA